MSKQYKICSIHLPITLYEKIQLRCNQDDLTISEVVRPVLRQEFGNLKPGNPVKTEQQPSKTEQKPSKPSKVKQKIDYAKDYLKYGRWDSKAKTWTCKLCGIEAGGGQKFVDHLKTH